MIPLLGAWTPVIAVVIAWALLGVEGMSRDVGLVFGSSGEWHRNEGLPTCLAELFLQSSQPSANSAILR